MKEREELETVRIKVRATIQTNSPEILDDFDDLIFLPQTIRGDTMAYTAGNYVYVSHDVMSNRELLKHIIQHETAHYVMHERGNNASIHDAEFFTIFRDISGQDFRSMYNDKGQVKQTAMRGFDVHE